jgi:hypothetical protein
MNTNHIPIDSIDGTGIFESNEYHELLLIEVQKNDKVKTHCVPSSFQKKIFKFLERFNYNWGRAEIIKRRLVRGELETIQRMESMENLFDFDFITQGYRLKGMTDAEFISDHLSAMTDMHRFGKEWEQSPKSDFQYLNKLIK